MTAGELADARKRLNLTQKEMAKRLKTPLKTYQDWEQGRAKISGVVEVAVMSIKD